MQPEQLTFHIPEALSYSGDLAQIIDGIDLEAAEFRPYVKETENPETGETKFRKLFDPSEAMAELHTRLKDYLRARPVDGSKNGHLISTKEYIEPHRGNGGIIAIDLKKAYNQVETPKLSAIMHAAYPGLGTIEEVEDFLRRFCMRPWPAPNGLITGANSSNDLFNLYCLPMDLALDGFCQEHGVTYTRYMDDLLFSKADRFARGKRSPGYLNSKLRNIVLAEGFVINNHKTRVATLDPREPVKGYYRQVRRQPVIVSGIQINPDWTYWATTQYLRNAAKRLEVLREAALWCPDKETADQIAGSAAGIKGVVAQRADEHRRFAHPLEAKVYKTVAEVIELAGQSEAVA